MSPTIKNAAWLKTDLKHAVWECLLFPSLYQGQAMRTLQKLYKPLCYLSSLCHRKIYKQSVRASYSSHLYARVEQGPSPKEKKMPSILVCLHAATNPCLHLYKQLRNSLTSAERQDRNSILWNWVLRTWHLARPPIQSTSH